jgi:aspartate kinase
MLVKIIVQKFGGTSVASAEGRQQAMQRIIKAKEEGLAPVVVVSAMGRKGEPYATDTLIGVVKEIHEDIKKRELDLLVSCGEIISTVVMAHSLTSIGHPAVAFTGWQAGIQTDENHGNAHIVHIDPQHIVKQAEQGNIVIVAGFQGIGPDGSITTLGRGGSDTTATALGSALKAEVVEIYTDVDGVMTVDPRVVPQASILEDVTYKEICEMAYQGAKVIHPRAVEAAMAGGVPIKIKNTFSDAKGTLIAQDANERVITGLAHIPGLAQVSIPTDDEKSSKIKVQVFKLLAEAKINVDLISVTPQGMRFTVHSDDALKAVALINEKGYQTQLVKDVAKVSVIGAGMLEVPGVMAKAIEALESANIEILQTSDSDITISFLVNEADMKNTINVLFETFKLG